jgi:hypothetical protein
MRGVTGVRRGLSASVRVALAVALLAGSVAQQGTAQDRGIDWVNFEIGIDFNGDTTSRGAPKYFAQIHLLIPLSEAQRDSADSIATARDIDSLKHYLKAWLDSAAANDANRAIIDALEFRPETAAPGSRGIDWVNIGTGTDYSGDPSVTRSVGAPMYFADIHLRIDLKNLGQAQRVSQAAERGDLAEVQRLLHAALLEVNKDNSANVKLVNALRLRHPTQER